jgi:hypothetical protein
MENWEENVKTSIAKGTYCDTGSWPMARPLILITSLPKFSKIAAQPVFLFKIYWMAWVL